MKQHDKDPLDKLFASLAEPQAQMPPASFLQDLEARLDALEKKRRKPFAFWFFLAAFAALLFGASFYAVYFSDAKHQAQAKANSVRIHSQSDSSALSSSTSLRASLNSHPIISSPLATQSTSSLTSSSSPKPTPTPSSNLSSLVSSFTSSTSIESSSSFSSSFSTPSAPATSITDVAQETYITNPISLIDDPEIVSTLPSEDQGTVSTPKAIVLNCPKSKHQFGLQFGVSAIFSSFEVDKAGYSFTPEPVSAEKMRAWRELTERQTSSWDFNFRYQYHWSNWGLQTGLNYLEWGEQLKYDVISVEGTNRYQYLQIPLGLSYRKPLQKLTLQPALGVGLGYGLKRQGAYILPLNNGVAEVLSKKFVLNAYAQFELIYQVNEQLQFSVAPMYRYTLGKVLSSQYIKTNYQSLGLLTGFSFSF